MKHIAIIVLLVMFSEFLPAQDEPFIEVFGTLSTELEMLKNAQIKIKEDDKSWLNIKFSKRNGEFDLALPLGHMFLFKFIQEGTVEKIISFDTRVPKEYEKVDYAPVLFMVNLEKYSASPEIDTLFYNEPVGKFFFNEEFIKFDYDREYDLFVKNKIKEKEEEILLAQKNATVEQLTLFVAETIDTTRDILSLANPDDSINFVEPKAISTIQSDSVVVEEALVVAEVLNTEQEQVEMIVDQEAAKKQEVVIEKQNVKHDYQAAMVSDEPKESLTTTSTVQSATKPEPKPMAIGLSNGKKTEFKQLENVHITKIYLTKSRKTIIYSMFQYSNGITRYYKQQPVTNDSISISKALFTQSIK